MIVTTGQPAQNSFNVTVLLGSKPVVLHINCTKATVNTHWHKLSHRQFVIADPGMVRQVLVKDFNHFHDRFMPHLNKSLKSGKRRDADRAGMHAAR